MGWKSHPFEGSGKGWNYPLSVIAQWEILLKKFEISIHGWLFLQISAVHSVILIIMWDSCPKRQLHNIDRLFGRDYVDHTYTFRLQQLSSKMKEEESFNLRDITVLKNTQLKIPGFLGVLQLQSCKRIRAFSRNLFAKVGLSIRPFRIRIFFLIFFIAPSWQLRNGNETSGGSPFFCESVKWERF